MAGLVIGFDMIVLGKQAYANKSARRLSLGNHLVSWCWALAFSMLALAVGSRPTGAAEFETVPEDILLQIEKIVGMPGDVSGRGLEFSLNAPDGVYREGETIEFRVTAPDYDGFLYLDYYQIDGNVVHILPAPGNHGVVTQRGSKAVIGASGAALTYEIFPPFGRELLVLMASPEPLFDRSRPEFESGRGYLEDLRTGIDGDLLSVVYRAIQTYEKDAVIAAAPKSPDRAAVEPAPPAPDKAAAQSSAVDMPVAKTDPAPVAPAPAMKPEPEPEPVSVPAPEPKQTAALPAPPPSDEFARLRQRIGDLLKRMQQAPGDDENLAELVTAYRVYAQKLVERGDYGKASRSLAMAMALDPTNEDLTAFSRGMETKIAVRLAYDEGLTQLSDGKADTAYETFQAVLKLDPDNSEARQRVDQLTPEVIELYHKKALIAFRRQDLDLALEIWDKVLKIDPNYQKAKINRMLALDLKERLLRLQSVQ